VHFVDGRFALPESPEAAKFSTRSIIGKVSAHICFCPVSRFPITDGPVAPRAIRATQIREFGLAAFGGRTVSDFLFFCQI